MLGSVPSQERIRAIACVGESPGGGAQHRIRSIRIVGLVPKRYCKDCASRGGAYGPIPSGVHDAGRGKKTAPAHIPFSLGVVADRSQAALVGLPWGLESAAAM